MSENTVPTTAKSGSMTSDLQISFPDIAGTDINDVDVDHENEKLLLPALPGLKQAEAASSSSSSELFFEREGEGGKEPEQRLEDGKQDGGHVANADLESNEDCTITPAIENIQDSELGKCKPTEVASFTLSAVEKADAELTITFDQPPSTSTNESTLKPLESVQLTDQLVVPQSTRTSKSDPEVEAEDDNMETYCELDGEKHDDDDGDDDHEADANLESNEDCMNTPAIENIQDSDLGNKNEDAEMIIPLDQPPFTTTNESALMTPQESVQLTDQVVVQQSIRTSRSDPEVQAETYCELKGDEQDDDHEADANLESNEDCMNTPAIENIQDSDLGNKNEDAEMIVPLDQPPFTTTNESALMTPQELHKRIKNSRDKLFFIAYAEPPHSTKWYLVRVDLSSSALDEESRDCKNTGKYYVEYYAKASYDQGILLPGYPLEDDIPAAQMKPKPDSESRYWLEWHEFHVNKNEEMVLGKWKEFSPNTAKEINRRLMDLSHKNSGRSISDKSASGNEVAQHIYEKYIIWANIVDLLDVNTRLVGPFDFEDVNLSPLTAQDLVPFDEETKKLFVANRSNLFVKDRVPLSRWQELLKALKGRDICPPTVVEQTSKERTRSKPFTSAIGGKRSRSVETTALFQDTTVKRHRENLSCLVCQECLTNDEGKGELLTFPATPAKAPFHVHVSCAKQSKSYLIVSKEIAKREVTSLLETTLTQTRQASVGRWRTYFMINELQDTLNEAVDKWIGELNMSSHSPRVRKPPSRSPTDGTTRLQRLGTQCIPPENPPAAEPLISSCEPLQGLSTTNFTTGEIDSFPVAYAYYKSDPDGVSEENAKIATLNHETRQRQLRRTSTLTGTQPKKNIRQHGLPITNEMIAQYSPEPAEEFPDGWIMITKKRLSTGSRVADNYWYSPKERYMFRSRAEVRRFLEALEKSGGDETKAKGAVEIGKKRK